MYYSHVSMMLRKKIDEEMRKMKMQRQCGVKLTHLFNRFDLLYTAGDLLNKVQVLALIQPIKKGVNGMSLCECWKRSTSSVELAKSFTSGWRKEIKLHHNALETHTAEKIIKAAISIWDLKSYLELTQFIRSHSCEASLLFNAPMS